MLTLSAGVAEPRSPIVSRGLAGRPVAGARVARFLARSLAPQEADCPIPPWLLPGQRGVFRRVVHAVLRYGGCLLADPVGSGKTYVALAVARALSARPACCLVPAALIAQWRATARDLGVDIVPWSHTLLSRGRLPTTGAGLVIIDESHHFRNPATKRYGTVAPWVSGRPVLMLSATPLVNRVDDLVHQLALGVRDDALRIHGVASLRHGVENGRPHQAMGQVIIVGPEGGGGARPVTRHRTWRWPDSDRTLDRAIRLIDRLALSRNPQLAALLRGVFYHALSSSPAALSRVACNYRGLLNHARDAVDGGGKAARSMIRQFTAAAPAQLVMWAVLPRADTEDDLVLDDLPAIELLAREVVSGDAKFLALERLLRDGRRTLVFTIFQATAAYLRRRLGPRTVWCTGTEAGIGAMRVGRQQALEAFRSPPGQGGGGGGEGSSVLVSTDVLAEGLDLRAAARVVHYDLPWHGVGLEQRNGRAVRAGSIHDRIDIVRFHPPADLESRLAITRTMERKIRLAQLLGLSGRREFWRWRGRVAADLGCGPGGPGVALVRSGPRGILVGVVIRGSGRRPPRGALECPAVRRCCGETQVLATTVVWIDRDGWTEDPAVVTERLLAAQRHETPHPLAAGEVAAAVAAANRVARRVMERLRRGRWSATSPVPGLRAVIHRLRAQAVGAARRRDRAALDRLDDSLRFLSGGHTAGERALIAGLVELPEEALAGTVFPPADPAPQRIEAEISGIVLFRPGRGGS